MIIGRNIQTEPISLEGSHLPYLSEKTGEEQVSQSGYTKENNLEYSTQKLLSIEEDTLNTSSIRLCDSLFIQPSTYKELKELIGENITSRFLNQQHSQAVAPFVNNASVGPIRFITKLMRLPGMPDLWTEEDDFI